MKVIIIVAAAENNSIGKDNNLLWHLPDDFKHFKSHTSGNYIIMGRKTFESFPKPLPNRTHIILTRGKYNVPEGCQIASSIEGALSIIPKTTEKVFIIGGGEIYKQAMPFATHIELTRVHTHIDGDTYFPEIDNEIWELISEIHHPKDQNHIYDFTFLSYQKKTSH